MARKRVREKGNEGGPQCAVFARVLNQELERASVSGLSQRKAAEECAKRGAVIDHTSLSFIRRGKQLPPDDSVVEVLADVLGVDDKEAFAFAAGLGNTPRSVLRYVVNRVHPQESERVYQLAQVLVALKRTLERCWQNNRIGDDVPPRFSLELSEGELTEWISTLAQLERQMLDNLLSTQSLLRGFHEELTTCYGEGEVTGDSQQVELVKALCRSLSDATGVPFRAIHGFVSYASGSAPNTN